MLILILLYHKEPSAGTNTCFSQLKLFSGFYFKLIYYFININIFNINIWIPFQTEYLIDILVDLSDLLVGLATVAGHCSWCSEEFSPASHGVYSRAAPSL